MTPASSSLHELLVEAAGRILEAEPNFDAAYRNIANAMPGYRADTLPTGHNTGDTTHPERYETINGALANTARTELNHHVRLVFASAAAIHRIISAWTPGTAADTPVNARPLDPADWCSSCLRIGKCAPRHRGDLCRWCYDFHKNFKRYPPLELVRDHHEGRRITEDRIKDALRIRAS